MKKVKDVKKIVQLAFVFLLLTPLLLYATTKYFSKDVKSADPPVISSISPTSGTYLGGGSLTITSSSSLFSTYTQISSGYSHTCGLGSDNQAYCWGYNNRGQLGNGSTTDSNVPAQVSSGAIPSGVTLTSISAGSSHTCGLGSDGHGYCWGYNYYGQLGDGSTTNSNVPVQVSSGAIPTGVTLVSISAGYNHTCGMGSDNQAYCWGYNYYGQLGNGSTTNSNVPVQVSSGAIPSGVTLASISAGGSHTCGMGSDNQAYCWGYNNRGQLGNGSTTDSNVPVQVSSGAIPSGMTLSSISPGDSHTCGLGSDNQAYCWGYNNYGQLGNGSTTNSNVPVQVSSGAIPSGVTLVSISAGYSHTCGLGDDGKGYCWGYNNYGQLGNGSTTQSTVPVQVSSGAIPSGVTLSSISAGGFHTCGLGSDGHGYCWGFNYYGQLGNGSTTQSRTPVSQSMLYQVNIGNNSIIQLVPQGSTTITITPIPAHVSGSVSVSLTRLSDNVTSNSVNYTYTTLPAPNISGITPSAISGSGGSTLSISGSSFLDYAPIDTLSNISAGYNHTCGIGSDGKGYCWGNNGNGQLGNGSTTKSTVPVQVSSGAIPTGVTLVSISAGGFHTCGIGSDGKGYCWGYNYYGQLGNGSTTDSNVPAQVSSGAIPTGVTLVSISAGYNHTCGIGSDGNGYCWGYNYDGQLGNGSDTDSNVPVQVSAGAIPSGVTLVSVSAGYYHTCGIGSDGKGYCWGNNGNGQLGNGSTTKSTVPVQVSSGAIPTGVTLVSISAGGFHTCGMGSDNQAYCWGYNYYGQLGNGSTTKSTVPVQVSSGAIPTGVTLVSISAGYYHTCGLGDDGHGYCWGYNYYGRLGNGSTTNSNVPVQVSSGAIPSGTTLSSISTGYSHTCGMGSDGHGYCWGSNSNGQLGNMETTDRPAPSYILKKEIPTIEFGSTPATSTTYTSTSSMSAVSPSLSTTGTLAVKLTNPDGQYATYNIFVGDPPSEPLGLLTTYGDAQVSLGWLKPTTGDLISDYIIQYSNDGGSTWSTFNDGVSTNTSTTVTGLTNGHLYTFRVAAVNPAGTGPYSATAQSVPQELSITSITPNSGVYLGGGSMSIEATGLGETLKLRDISSGSYHTCGIGSDGHGYCWGYNYDGQLGDGSTTQSTVPVQVSSGAIPSGVTLTSISAGGSHTCGIGSDGHGYCWGYNGDGQLGNGSTTNSNVPVQVSSGAIPTGVTLVSISAGSYHTCGIGSDGHGYCWGYNYDGRLGNGSTTNSNVPVQVSSGAIPTGVTLVSISAGYNHTCGMGSDNQAYCWGYNSYGRLGNGSTTNSNVPVQVSAGAIPSGVTLASISAGGSHTCGLGSDNQAYCWGYNYYGQLGNGSTTNSNVPVQVSSGAIPTGVTLVSISAGYYHTCGLGDDGHGYCWGYNYYGRLGNGSTTNSNVPVQVSSGAIPSGTTLSSISTGYSHTCGMGSDGHGYCWGYNGSGQLGNGSTTQSTTPVSQSMLYQVNIGNNSIIQLVPQGSTTITITPIPAHVSGSVSVSLTRLSDNVTSNSVTYTYTNLPAPNISSITPSAISGSGGSTLSISGSSFLDYAPMDILSNISAGGSHTCAIGSDGKGYCWGYNSSGQLGNGRTTQSTIPVQVSSGAIPSGVTLTSISAGYYRTCGIGSDGHGYCWGYNYDGQLGDGSTTQSTVPVQVSSGAIPSGVTLTSISAGGSHTCGIGSDGHGYCWGYNGDGQLGNGSTTDSNVPAQVSSGAIPSGVTLTSISAGSSHTCGLGSDGHGYCWGYNYYGQLGDGSTTNSNVPVQVSSGAIPTGVTLVSISAGYNHTCGMGSDNQAYCWGYNYYGQLGNGSDTDSNVPVQVSAGAIPSGITLISISAGYYHTCGLGDDGHGYCWGYNYYGQLGNGSTTKSTVPVQVSSGAIPTGVTLTSISAGQYHTCGIGSDGKGYCWGYNGSGQLGNMETTDRPAPSYILKKEIPTIEFGSTPATSTTYTSTSSMSAVSPSLSTTGTLAVKLTNPDGQYATYNITVVAPPTEPLNLTATAGNKQVTLNWTVPSSNGGATITDYIVQYSTNGSTWTTFDDGVSTSTSATVTGLTNGQQYYFRVAAVNSVGQGPYTSSVTATPVNQPPTFTSVSNNSPVAPGSSVTWNTTAYDPDSNQVKLVVCDSQGITGSTCNGTELCSSSLVASNPSCSHTATPPYAAGPHDAYVYVFDGEGLAASGGVHNTNSVFYINNVAPSVLSVTINSGNAITLLESTTTSVSIKTQIESNNGCQSIGTVTAYLYRSGKGYTYCNKGADADNNFCYSEISCIRDAGECTAPYGKTARYTCTASVWYYADPTDTQTQYDSQNWLATVKATVGTVSGTAQSSGVEMNSLVAFSVTETLNYGTLIVNQTTDPLDKIVVTTATGNVGLNQNHSGENMGMCVDYPTCTVGTPIGLSHQKYSTSQWSSYTDSSVSKPLTDTPTLVELRVPKVTSIPISRNTWWGISIPSNTLPGSYEGLNRIEAVKSNIADW
ncbi:MAG: fibronectin type III domain-containing protein [Candidatus Dojkabacteria bacterium]